MKIKHVQGKGIARDLLPGELFKANDCYYKANDCYYQVVSITPVVAACIELKEKSLENKVLAINLEDGMITVFWCDEEVIKLEQLEELKLS